MSGEKMKKGRQGFNLEPTLVSDDLGVMSGLLRHAKRRRVDFIFPDPVDDDPLVERQMQFPGKSRLHQAEEE